MLSGGCHFGLSLISLPIAVWIQNWFWRISNGLLAWKYNQTGRWVSHIDLELTADAFGFELHRNAILRLTKFYSLTHVLPRILKECGQYGLQLRHSIGWGYCSACSPCFAHILEKQDWKLMVLWCLSQWMPFLAFIDEWWNCQLSQSYLNAF